MEAGLIALGFYEDAFSVMHKDDPATRDLAIKNPIRLVTSIINLEIAAMQIVNKNDVGPPVTSARFDKFGLHRIEVGACK